MKKYNRALDYTVLALSELKAGKTTLAARLLATAVQQPDINRAIAVLEASNKQAFKMEASAKRLRASDEFPFEDGAGDGELAADLGDDFEGDPLDEVQAADEDDEMEDDNDEVEAEFDDEDEDEPVMARRRPSAAVAMARVLAKMKRR